MTVPQEAPPKCRSVAGAPESQVIQFRRSTMETLPSARVRADELATRLVALAEEVGALPVAEENNEKERRSASAAVFARTLLRERRLREAEFPRELLGEPVWDILLDLFAAHEEGNSVSISSACIASGAPPTTALRYIAAMERSKLLTREACSTDKRTSYLRLSCVARLRMGALLSRMRVARGLLDAEPAGPDQGAQPED